MRSSSRSINAAAALLLLAASGAFAAPAAPRRLPPVDQCAADPGFAAFMVTLRQILVDHDRDGLLNLLAADVVVDFGGGKGHGDFVKNWNLERPEVSRFWHVAGKALMLGCARIEQHYVAPSLAWQLGDDDEIFELVLARPGAMLKSVGRDDGPDVMPLEWHLLKVDERAGGGQWVAVTLSDGRKGFVHRDYLRSPLDYHFTFEKRGGRWQISAFVAGD